MALAQDPLPDEAAASRTGTTHAKRQVLTVLSYDLVGSTRLLESLDIEDYQDLIAEFQSGAAAAIAACSGEIESVEGDGGLAVFPTDIDAKDAASLAIHAGFEVIASCARLAARRHRGDLQVRVGIATSLSLVRGGGAAEALAKVSGPAIAMATRLQALAMPGTIFVSHETRSLARRSHVFDRQGTRALKGFATPERVWRALRRKREVGRYFAFGRLGGPLIDRVEDQRLLAEGWANAVKGQGQAILVQGEAGVGKSRLIHSVRSLVRAQHARRLVFQCLPSGLNSTLHPLLGALPKTDGQRLTAPAVARRFREQGIGDAPAIDVLAYLLGAEGAGQDLKDADVEDVRARADWAILRCIEELCAAGPMAIVVEDVHWIDPTSRQLLTAVLGAIAAHPLLLILTGRPLAPAERFDARHLRVTTLAPLAPGDTQKVIAQKLPAGADAADQALRDLIERVSGGMPLFIEEICQWVAENLQSAKESLARNFSPNHLSAFESVIAARLAPLGFAADIAAAAAVIGGQFGSGLLAALLPQHGEPAIAAALAELTHQGFLVQMTLADTPLYGFRHALIRETVYKSLLRDRKQMLHGRLFSLLAAARHEAPWIETGEVAEHAERAGQTGRAIEYYLVAGGENAARSAMIEARRLLEHALVLCSQITGTDQRERLTLSVMAVLGPVLTSSEGPSSAPAQQLYEDGMAIARRRPSGERAQWFPIYWGWWFTANDVNGTRTQALLEDLRDVADPEVQLQARHCAWAVDFYLGKYGTCGRCVDEALPLYERLGEPVNPAKYGGHDTKVCGLVHRGLASWFGGEPSLALKSLAEAKAWARHLGHAGSIAHALVNSTMLACYRRDFAALAEETAELRAAIAGAKFPSLDATLTIIDGWRGAQDGDWRRGRDRIRAGLGVHQRLQTPEDYPVYCSMLAEIMIHTGECAEALGLLTAAAAAARDNGHLYWIAELHRRRALLLAHAGAGPDAVAEALAASLELAQAQQAVPLLLTAYDTLLVLQPASALAGAYRDAAEAARRRLDPAVPLYASPEPIILPGQAR